MNAAQSRRDDLLTDRDRHGDTAKEARRNAESARQDAARADKQVTLARDLLNKTDTANSATLEVPPLTRPESEQNETKPPPKPHSWKLKPTHRESRGRCRGPQRPSNVATKTRRTRNRDSRDDPGGNLDVIRAQAQSLREELSRPNAEWLKPNCSIAPIKP